MENQDVKRIVDVWMTLFVNAFQFPFLFLIYMFIRAYLDFIKTFPQNEQVLCVMVFAFVVIKMIGMISNVDYTIVYKEK
jgi:hypothetical protein